jgi:hypothetical protein
MSLGPDLATAKNPQPSELEAACMSRDRRVKIFKIYVGGNLRNRTGSRNELGYGALRASAESGLVSP